ncbi:quinol:cytochrome C oxidoreductase [uncultured Aquimarina sp.]|uniref:quinol:cytochrome C oxidoreductase n=1 Tax=uncultured Aquimarina sp. TaxID=575652 RepID=UPI00262D2EAC|nr:quinol:cytochrome C oxidoreductase [uncultured Aquimarina sp.]
MYTLSSKLRLFSIILVIIGALGLTYGFLSAPKTIEDVKEMAAHDAHGGGHGDAKATSGDHANESHVKEEAHGGDSHYEHTLHQLQNKPWAALYVAAFFFFMIALGVLAFYAIQFASQAGWSPVLFRVMEAITAYLVPGGIILFVILALSGFHVNHLFVWADETKVVGDKLLEGKASWLNGGWFIFRAAFFLGGWMLYRHFAVKYSRKQDEDTTGNKWYKKSFKIAAGFLVFFIYTESMASWDWIMSFDPHWFSTLFGWYVFASLFVSGITTIALITIYLKSKGYMDFVNDSHIHDLAKFMFGVSIFWTYLWFSQFMLIWYSNIPEEVTYFITRIEDYKLPFFGMVVMNFVFPLLVLMNSDYKRINWFVVMAGIIILCGHYVDIFNMVMPATVGESWFIGVTEISAVLLFLGLFLFIVFKALTKAPLLAKGNPYIEESKHFHY